MSRELNYTGHDTPVECFENDFSRVCSLCVVALHRIAKITILGKPLQKWH